MTSSLTDINLYGNRLFDAILEDVRLKDGVPTVTKVGQIYLKNGVPYYRNGQNVETLFNDGIQGVDTPEDSPLSVTMQGSTAIISIADATAQKSGALSAQLYSLLAGASTTGTPGSLVKVSDFGVVTVGAINTQTVAGLEDPTESSSATNKGYVDNLFQQSLTSALLNQYYKDPVDLLINQNFNLATALPISIQGVTVADSLEIGLIGQTNPVENGIYIVSEQGTLVRRPDSNSSDELKNGSTFGVTKGDFAGRVIILTTAGQPVIGTDPINFSLIDDSLLIGSGLAKTGKTVSVVGTENRISVNPDGVDIDPNYVGQESINTLGVITTGEWQSNEISVSRGGTGATTSNDALTALGAVTDWERIVGDGSALFFDITGDWNTMRPTITAFYNSEIVQVRSVITDENTVRIYASKGSTPLETNSLKITVLSRANY